LGAISTLLTTIGKHKGYQSQYDMHLSAVKSLQKLCLSIDVEKDWFFRTATSEYLVRAAKKRVQNPDAEDDLDTLLGADLKSHQAAFKAMQDSCEDSPVPTRVTQAFMVLEQTVGDGTGESHDLVFHYHKLWKEFSLSIFWPLFEPNVNIIKKYGEWKNEYGTRNNGPEALTFTAGQTQTYGSFASWFR
jgi:hypothetical protein